MSDSLVHQYSSLSLDCETVESQDSGLYSSLYSVSSNSGSGQHSRASTVSSSSASLGWALDHPPGLTSIIRHITGLFESKSCDSLLEVETDAEDASSHQSQSRVRNISSPSSHDYMEQDCSSLRWNVFTIYNLSFI